MSTTKLENPLDEETKEQILAMVFDPQMERASIGAIWENLRQSRWPTFPGQCMLFYLAKKCNPNGVSKKESE